MTSLRLRNRVLIASLASAFFGLSAFSSASFAGGTAYDGVSISGMGSANAGQAAEANDATAIFYNPAAMIRFKQAEVTQGAAFVTVDHSYTSNQNGDGATTDGSTNADGSPNKNASNTGSQGQVFDRKSGYDASALAPGLFVVIPLSPKTVMGFSSSASEALLLHYNELFPGRNQGKDIDFKVTRLNLGFAHRLTPTLSIGMNGSYERYYQKAVVKLNYEEAVRAQAGNAGVAALKQATTIPQETNAQIRVFGYAFNAQFGALWEPSDRTRVGISYRPKSSFTNNKGTFTLDDTAQAQAFRAFLRGNTANTLLPGASQSADDLEPYQRVHQSIKLNDELRLSVFHHYSPRLDLLATYTREDFSSGNLTYVRDNGRLLENVPQNFQITRSYRIGGNYKLYRRLTVRAGFAYETGAIDDATRITILPDNNRRFYAFGGTFNVDPNTDIHFAYQHFKIDPAVVGLNNSSEPSTVRGGQFLGTTRTSINFFGLGVTQRF